MISILFHCCSSCRGCSLNQKLFLHALLSELKRTGLEETTVKEVSRKPALLYMYMYVCDLLNMLRRSSGRVKVIRFGINLMEL